MINDGETDVNVVATNSTVKLQTEVSKLTKNYLRLEAVRRGLTMGQLLDELLKMFYDVSKTTS
jgi:hypothetical protein